MPYNVEAQRVNHYSRDETKEFVGRPHHTALPALLRHGVDLAMHTNDENVVYRVVRIQCSAKRPPPIRVKRHRTSSSSSSPPATAVAEEDEEKTTMVISNEILCALQNRLFRGIYYSFLMTHSLQGKKTSANIGYGTNPMLDVYLHNHLKTNDRTTSAAAPYWVLDMALGPFITKESAIGCCEEWVSGTRGKESKRKKASLLKILYNTTLYDATRTIKGSFRDYLRHNAPPSYLVRYDALMTEREKK